MKKKLFSFLIILSAVLPLFALKPPAAYSAVPIFETNPAILEPTELTRIFTGGNLAQDIKEFVFKLTMENMKRQMLDALVSQMVTGIAGGKPQFVTNWSDFTRENYNTGVDEGIRDLQNSGLLGRNSFDPLIVSEVTGRPVANYSGPSAEENLRRENFTSWDDYLSLWSPENNYYGKRLLVEDYVTSRGVAKAEAAKNEALAGGGFLSSKDAQGNITTPGKTVGDTLSRAVTSDIDYIVNADDLASFASTIGNSIFNKMLGGFKGFSGVVGIAESIMDKDGTGIGSFKPSDLTQGLSNLASGFLFKEGNDFLDKTLEKSTGAVNGSNGSGGRVDQINTSISGLAINAVNDISSNDLLGGSVSGYRSGYYSGDYEGNKKESYQEVQKTIWYLEDIKKAGGSASLIDPLLTSLTTIKTSLNNDLNDISSANKDNANTQKSTIQKILLSDLYTADLTVKIGNNFDFSNTLPINLNTPNMVTFNSAVAPTVITRSDYLFTNKTAYRDDLGRTSGGSENYLGINIPATPKPTPFFEYNSDNLNNYSTALDRKIKNYNNNYTSRLVHWTNDQTGSENLASDYQKQQKIYSLKQKIDSFILELYKAKLYLADVGTISRDPNPSVFKNLDILQFNIDKSLEEKQNLSSLVLNDIQAKSDLKKKQLVSAFDGGVLDLYSAGLTGRQNIDSQGKLPITDDTLKSIIPISDFDLAVNSSILPPPYSGQSIFGSINTKYFWIGGDNKTDFIDAFNERMDKLTSSNLLLSLPTSYNIKYNEDFSNFSGYSNCSSSFDNNDNKIKSGKCKSFKNKDDIYGNNTNLFSSVNLLIYRYWNYSYYNYPSPRYTSLPISLTLPLSSNIKLRFYRLFDNNLFYNNVSKRYSTRFSEILLDDKSLESEYLPDFASVVSINVPRKSWAYREYNVSNLSDKTINLTCKSTDNNIKLYNDYWKGDQQPLSCGLDNIQIVSY